MKKWSSYLTMFIIAIIGALAVQHFIPSSGLDKGRQESGFDRVMRTKILRCGYVVYPPTIIKDPTTGQMSGLMYEAIEEAAAKLGLKVEWSAEMSWGDYLTALAYDRADMICAAAWNNTAEEWEQTESIGPLFYSGIGVWVKSNDDRFSNNLALINDPAITISSIDGTIPGRIAATDFPKAKVLSLPQTADYTFNLLNVANGKADVTFVENYQGYSYNEKNPGVLKNIAAVNPIRVFPNVYLVRKGELKLKTMFQSVFQDMANNGEIETIIRKYEKYPGAFYRTAKPYQSGQ